MKDLLEAIAIFAKYTDAQHPTCCEHDVLYVLVDPAQVPDIEKARLDALGFSASARDQNFYSHRFGSA